VTPTRVCSAEISPSFLAKSAESLERTTQISAATRLGYRRGQDGADHQLA